MSKKNYNKNLNKNDAYFHWRHNNATKVNPKLTLITSKQKKGTNSPFPAIDVTLYYTYEQSKSVSTYNGYYPNLKLSPLSLLLLFATLGSINGIMACNEKFNPMDGMKVLQDGKPEIGLLPNGIVCCALSQVFAKSNELDVPPAELHVTTVGSKLYPAINGYNHLFTNIYPIYNALNLFDIEGTYSAVCRAGGDQIKRLKLTTANFSNKEKIEDLKSTLPKNTSQPGLRNVSFTFFASNQTTQTNALFRCWQPDEDTVLGAILEANGYMDPSYKAQNQLDIKGTYSDVCRAGDDETEKLNSTTTNFSNKTKIKDLKSTLSKKASQSILRNADLTFFPSNQTKEKNALSPCWQPDEESVVGAILESRCR